LVAPSDGAYQVSNPLTQANASFKMRESADPRDRVIGDPTAKKKQGRRKAEQRAARIPPNRISLPLIRPTMLTRFRLLRVGNAGGGLECKCSPLGSKKWN
jgi:hypothetical protein